MATKYNQDWQTTKKTVLERNCFMFNNPLISDITFTCGKSEKQFYAHKYVLATSSPVFYAMFYGDLAGKSSLIHLLDTDAEGFEQFLCFLYTDQCTLTPEIAIKVIYLAKKYIVPSLTEKCVEILQSSIKPENAFAVLEQAIRFDECELEDKCWKVVDSATIEAVSSAGFKDTNQNTLTCLLKRNTLTVREVVLFQAVLDWSDHQCSKRGLEATGENRRAVVGDAIYKISFISMTQKEFAQHVPSSGLLTAEEMIPIYGRLNGIESPALKWEIPSRNPKKVRFARFSFFDVCEPNNSNNWWSYSGSADRLSFSVNKSVKFHGVRLFGDDKGSVYEVSFEVSGVKTSGTYSTECDCGFDVLLPAPIVIDKNKVITMSAQIHGPISHYGKKGKSSVEIDGVSVMFKQANGGSTNGTDASQGQFYQIIVSM